VYVYILCRTIRQQRKAVTHTAALTLSFVLTLPAACASSHMLHTHTRINRISTECHLSREIKTPNLQVSCFPASDRPSVSAVCEPMSARRESERLACVDNGDNNNRATNWAQLLPNFRSTWFGLTVLDGAFGTKGPSVSQWFMFIDSFATWVIELIAWINYRWIIDGVLYFFFFFRPGLPVKIIDGKLATRNVLLCGHCRPKWCVCWLWPVFEKRNKHRVVI
jgi:hypothetical protein